MKKTNPSAPWRPFQNVSHEDRYWFAAGKLAKNFWALIALDLLCYWIYTTGTWSLEDGKRILAVCLPILLYVNFRLFLRYLLMGFFACLECRRLKTASHLSLVNLDVRHQGDCSDCARFVMIQEELGRSVVTSMPTVRPFGGEDPTSRRRECVRLPAPKRVITARV